MHIRFKNNSQHYSRQSGFSLIETLVAITILVTATIGPMTIAVKGLQNAFFAREQLTAVYLAQEGVEMVRLRRDNYSLANTKDVPGRGTVWYDSLPAECRDVNKKCDLDSRALYSATAVDCSVSNACLLKYDSGPLTGQRGVYTHTGSGGAIQNSQFTRTILVTGGNAAADVVVDVSWRSGLFQGTKSVTMRTVLTNQYDDY